MDVSFEVLTEVLVILDVDRDRKNNYVVNVEAEANAWALHGCIRSVQYEENPPSLKMIRLGDSLKHLNDHNT